MSLRPGAVENPADVVSPSHPADVTSILLAAYPTVATFRPLSAQPGKGEWQAKEPGPCYPS
jgi:hypothetical protein